MLHDKPFVIQIHGDEGDPLGLILVKGNAGEPTLSHIRAHWESFKDGLEYPEDFDNVWDFIHYLREQGMDAERHFFSTDMDLYTNW